MKIWQKLKVNKEGLVLGAIAGFIVGKWLSKNFDWQDALVSEGFVDVIAGAGKSALEIAKTKLIYTTTIIGATVGYLADSALKEGWYKKYF